MAPTPSEQPVDQAAGRLRELRAGVLRRPGLVCAPLRAALTDAYDGWLRERLPDSAGVALVAVGSLGRREPSPYSDLDLMLLRTGRRTGVRDLADGIWYPIWDAGVGLDHSVRTPDEAVAVAKDDLKALLNLLDMRHVAGDPELSAVLRERVLDLWRTIAPKRVDDLHELSRARWELAGEGAFLLEPNLKESRGGLRDVRTMVALARAQLVDLPSGVRSANATLLDLRGELHRVAERADDVLRLQEHDPVAAALGLFDGDGGPDRDEVLRRANLASRTVAHDVDLAFGRVAAPVARAPLRRRLFGGSSAPAREGIARDVVAQDGEAVLARDAAPGQDPGLVVRAARAAAEHALRFGARTLDRLAAEGAPVTEPWPDEVREDFVRLLGAGPAAVPVLESLDFAGLLSPLLPEWDAVRGKAQHNPVHRFTVDRHLLETSANAAGRTRDVGRPDLLLVGALLHDIGKGFPPHDHSLVGATHTRAIATRMGFPPGDVDVLEAMTRHHLLLPETATRRDLDDPVTIAIVTQAVDGSAEVVELLHELAFADAAATGPAAWSDWKAGLVTELATRARAVLAGGAMPSTPPLDDERRELAEAGRLAVVTRDREVLVAAPDAVGVLYRTAGVLALHSLNVRQASIRTHARMAVNSFVVEPRFGRLPDATLIRADLVRALDGQLALADRLREKELVYADGADHRPPTVRWFDDEATDATVLELRTEDRIGLLTRITAALERRQLDVQHARIASLGRSVVLVFYLTDRDGKPVATGPRADVEVELRSV